MAGTDFKYDVFISYSHKDEEWVRNILLPTLEKQGLKTCIDYRDFIAGKPAITNMADASEASRHTLLVLSPRWDASEWTLYEGILSRTADPAGLQRRTIPLLLEKCNVPKFIAMLSWVDFTDKKREAEAWQNLFKSLDKEVDKVEVAKAEPDSWYLAHPYPMPPNFTGRAAELEMLDKWLADDKDRLFILRALGGFGKSALAWQWINTHVNPAEWTKLVWWSFYEGDASFEHFIEETLKYLKLDVPQGQRPQVDALLKAMQSQKILLIMDGFERALRLYANMNAAYQSDEEENIEDAQLDCVNISAEWFLKGVCSLPNIKSKVLMTTRLTPRAIKPRAEFILGCREEELTAMQKADAVEFFHKQGIKGTHAEIETACASYGYHPLSLRILAGLILYDREIPGDITIAASLDITDNVIQNKNHVLEIAYSTLSNEQKKLLSNMACFRTSINFQALKAITDKPSWKRKNKSFQKESLDVNLRALESRGLAARNQEANKYDLHPIVRRFAYERLTDSDRIVAHARLKDYFKDLPKPKTFRTIEDLALMVELYYHTVKTGKLDEALNLFITKFGKALHYQFGNPSLEIELLSGLFRDKEFKNSNLRNNHLIGFALNQLGNAYSINGQPLRSALLIGMSLEKVKREASHVISLGNLSNSQLAIGALGEAERTARRSIEIGRELAGAVEKAYGHYELSKVLSYCGAWSNAEHELNQAFSLIEQTPEIQALSDIWSHRAQYYFLLARHDQSNFTSIEQAIASSIRALALANEMKQKFVDVPRSFVHAHWLLGAAYRINRQLDLSEHHLNEALTRDRAINMVMYEADILLDLARLRYDQANYEEAKSLADEALTITERCGYVLQGADVNLFLATLALEGHTLERSKFDGKWELSDKEVATLHAKEALKLATCDGPPYYYKVAYEEAERMLASLNV